MRDFRKHLSAQLGYVNRSCAAFDVGHLDEAIRVAVAARVLIHQTKNSTSLLKHLNATTINLLTTCEGANARTVLYIGMGTIRVHGDGRSEYFASLEDAAFRAFVPVSKWWDQVVFVKGRTRASRRHIVLSASNQDGGAHVDERLDQDYEALSMAGFAGEVGRASGGDIASVPLEQAHLICLRQIGYELLNSPELCQLAEG